MIIANDAGGMIVRLAGRGDGVTADGRHVPGAVPGDVLAADGTLVPGPNRAVPMCRHFGRCGGCQLQHVGEGELARYVTDRVTGALAAQQVAAAMVCTAHLSPPASRRRTALSAMRLGQTVQVGFQRPGSHQIADMRECALLAPSLFALVAPLRGLLKKRAPPRRMVRAALQMLDQGVELVLSGASVAGLDGAMAVQDFAAAHQLARLVVDQGDGPETLWEPQPATVTLGGVAVAPPPGAFLQATPDGEAALVAGVAEAIGDAVRVADLFSGIGTFAFALHAGHKLLAVEGARDAVQALATAAARRQLAVTTAHRDLYRRPLTKAELAAFDAVILDPPRAGAEEQARELAASTVPRIAYVSCNPASFARDARLLVAGGYRIDWVRPIGQFRWSTHVELVAALSRGG